MDRLRSRPDYQSVAKGVKTVRPGLVLQGRIRDNASGAPRFGFTVSRQVGNAVERNRVRRRLKEAVRREAGKDAAPGADYVLIGRRAALSRPFDQLAGDLASGLAAVNRELRGKAATEAKGEHARG